MIPILSARDITVVYGDRTVVQVPHLDLFSGEVLAIIGPNGAGKSTLLRVLAALERPATGRLYFQGQEVEWWRSLAYRRRIAVVMQDPLLLDLPVVSNVALGWRLRGRLGKDVDALVQEWLKKFHIEHLAHARARHLSGGEARRVSLARAFVLRPAILFLDEPFAGLDVPSREGILMDLRQVLYESQTTALLVTHDRDEALALADRVAVLLHGRIRQVGPPDEVFMRPVDLEVAEFVGVENILPARVVVREGTRVRLRVGEAATLVARAPTAPAPTVHACIRPEYVRLTPSSAHDPDPAGGLVGRIARVYPLGSRVKVHVRVGEIVLSALMEYPRWTELGLREEDTVYVHIAPEHVHII